MIEPIATNVFLLNLVGDVCGSLAAPVGRRRRLRVDSGACGLRGYGATGLRGYEATELRGYGATGLRGYGATKLRSYGRRLRVGGGAAGRQRRLRVDNGVCGSAAAPVGRRKRLCGALRLWGPRRRLFSCFFEKIKMFFVF